MIAATDLRLAKLTANTLRALMRDIPEIDARVREAANERLATRRHTRGAWNHSREWHPGS